MTSMKKSLLAAAACAMLGLASTAQAGAIIDLFDDPVGGQRVETDVLGLPGVDHDQIGNFPASIIGGYRDLSVMKISDDLGTAEVPGDGVSKIRVSLGSLKFDNDTGVTGQAVITWDGASAAGANGGGVDIDGLGGIDVTSGGTADRFLVDVIRADLGFNYSISIWDMDGDKSTLSAGVQFQLNSKITTDYLFYWFNLPTGTYCNGGPVPTLPAICDPFTELQFGIVRTGAGDIDFTRIGAIQLTLIGARADVDMAIGSIRTVPEPATLGLVGLALLGAGAIGRRQARKA